MSRLRHDRRTSILLVLPLLQSLAQQNAVSYRMVDLLLAHNVAAPSSSEEDCSYLMTSVQSWLKMAAVPQPASLFENVEDTYVLWAQLLPVRCDFQQEDGVITFCDNQVGNGVLGQEVPGIPCSVWEDHRPANPEDATEDFFAEQLSLRYEGIRRISVSNESNIAFTTTVIYNHNPSVALV